eukprot:CAMPEP_0118902662 /NCGR_PEP_ID=MMETSP1166-20130328/7854_1 /TAXON_ID=1104430 /ORGANISM="Chrysoreinhardia sp, Strain CCMP3193" /LENGTH=108 /DNA_ID=CAMNT_0006841875 /DNA_START=134 /DNA_END=457 /DNA_ORIENTATION=+
MNDACAVGERSARFRRFDIEGVAKGDRRSLVLASSDRSSPDGGEVGRERVEGRRRGRGSGGVEDRVGGASRVDAARVEGRTAGRGWGAELVGGVEGGLGEEEVRRGPR